VLGAEQFDTSKPSEAAQQQSYFNYFYWSINIGASFSFGYLAWLATHGAPPLISENYGFFASFFIPSCFMAIAVLTFFLGRNRYKKMEPSGSALKNFLGVLFESARGMQEGRAILVGLCFLVVAFFLSIISYFICMNCEGVRTQNSSFMVAMVSAIGVVLGAGIIIRYGQRSSYLEKFAQSGEGAFDREIYNDSAEVVKQFPLMGFLVAFWCVYQQMTGNFVLQGCQMDLRLNVHSNTSVQLTPSQLNLLDCSVILAFIPIFDRYVYPTVGRYLGYSPRPLQKIGVGFLFAAMAMVTAGLVEMKRKNADLLCTSLEMVELDGDSMICPTGGNDLPSLPFSPGNGRCKSCDYEASSCGEDILMSDLSVFWQIPQYLLVGIAEILISVPSYEIFYSEVPEQLKSTCQSLNLLTTTFGGIVAGTINSLFSNWLPNNLNNGRMENMYFFIAALCALNLVTYSWTVSYGFEDGRGYVYKKDRNRRGPTFDGRVTEAGRTSCLGF